MDEVFEDLLSMMKLASTMTPAEVDFSYKLKEFNKITGRKMKIQVTSRDKTLLTWESVTGVIIACPIQSDALFFSEIGVLSRGYVMNLEVYFTKEPEMLCKVYFERDENQALLKMLIPGIPAYFR